MKILNSYKDWPILRRKGFGFPGDPSYYIEYPAYISTVIGGGINHFTVKTGFSPSHIVIGCDCRREVERQTMAETWNVKTIDSMGRNEIYGLKIVWGLENGIFLFYSPE